MNKSYVTPAANFIGVECNVIMTNPSAQIRIDGENSGNEQLSNKQQSTWGNLWNK